MAEYFYPEDVIVSVDDTGKRVARIGYQHLCVYDGTIQLSSDLPIIFTDDEIDSIVAAYHKVWIRARERNRKAQSDKFMHDREIIMAFWAEHRHLNCDPSMPDNVKERIAAWHADPRPAIEKRIKSWD